MSWPASHRLQVHELPKKQADLNYFSERCAEMEQAMAQDPSLACLTAVERFKFSWLTCVDTQFIYRTVVC